jgi:zinc-ribbon domain
MAYSCELSPVQKIYLDNPGTQTVVTIFSGSPGQQQQSSSSLQTGSWTAPPELFQTPNGVVLKIATAQGNHFMQIQGSSTSIMSGSPSFGSAQQMQLQQVASPLTSSMPSMEPMEPMQPMKMGNMSMNANPMEMRMGNMEMRMGELTQGTRRFCSQCGAAVQPEDRFCASCGHQLS